MMKNVKDIDDCVTSYLNSLKDFKSLNKEEEHKLLKKYKKENDIRARDELIKANLKYTCKLANSFRDKGVDFSFLISEANDALIETINKFDLKQDVKLMSYAKWWIIQRLQSVIDKKNKMKFSDLPEENDTSNIDDSDEKLSTTNDYFEKTDLFANNLDEEEEYENTKKFLDNVTEDLCQRERDMINMYYGITNGKECTLEDIGAKYNLTKERVRQIIETGFRKIRSKSILIDSKYLTR